MEKTCISLRLKSWKEFKNFVDGLYGNWVFRGQSDAQWGLQNAIERKSSSIFIKA